MVGEEDMYSGALIEVETGQTPGGGTSRIPAAAEIVHHKVAGYLIGD